MPFNTRIVQKKLTRGPFKGQDYFELHDVFYDEDGTPNARTMDPITFGGHSPEDIIKHLKLALKTFEEHGIITDEEIEREKIEKFERAKREVKALAEAQYKRDNPDPIPALKDIKSVDIEQEWADYLDIKITSREQNITFHRIINSEYYELIKCLNDMLKIELSERINIDDIIFLKQDSFFQRVCVVKGVEVGTLIITGASAPNPEYSFNWAEGDLVHLPDCRNLDDLKWYVADYMNKDRVENVDTNRS